MTPDPREECSKRAFDGKARARARALVTSVPCRPRRSLFFLASAHRGAALRRRACALGFPSRRGRPQVREWRRKLHDYDPAGQEEGLEEVRRRVKLRVFDISTSPQASMAPLLATNLCSRAAGRKSDGAWACGLAQCDSCTPLPRPPQPVPLAGQRRPAESEPEPLRPAQRSRSDVGAAAAPPAEQRSAGAQPSAQQAPLVKGAGATTAGAGAKPAEAAAAAVGKGAGAASSAGPPSGRADGDLFGAEDDEFGAL